MSKWQGYCDNCGSWSDNLIPIFNEMIGNFDKYCNKCK